MFKIETETGRLTVMRSLDREAKDTFNLKIKAENLIHRRLGKRETFEGSRYQNDSNLNYHLAFDEALVVVNVGDENDNSPVFKNRGKPVVAAVPLEASFGYQVVKLTVSRIIVHLQAL